MLYKVDGRHSDGTLCVYGYSGGLKVVIFRGFENHKSRTVTLYPKVRLLPTNEYVGKKVISVYSLG